MRIDRGCRVVARGAVRDEAGNLLDDGSRPFAFVVGRQETLAGIESAVIGRAAGERLSFACPPAAAYGAYRPELVFETPRANLPPDVVLTPGAVLHPGGSNGRFSLKVLELTANGARLDGNHPLAGRTLHFELEIVEVGVP